MKYNTYAIIRENIWTRTNILHKTIYYSFEFSLGIVIGYDCHDYIGTIYKKIFW